MSKKVATNYLLNLSYNILILVVPLITTPYISRTIGAEGIGIYTFCLSISTYFIVAGTIGIPLYGKRNIAFVKDNKKTLDLLFSELFTLQLLLLGSALIIYIIFSIIYHKYLYMFLACGLGIIAALFDVSWLYVGLEDFLKIVTRGVIFKIISVVTIFVFVKEESDLYLYAFCIMIANLVGNLWMVIESRKFAKYQRVKLNVCFKHIKPALILLLPNIVNTIYAVIDKTILGVIGSNMSEVGFYEQSQKIITLTLTVVTSLGTILMPRFATLFSERKNDEIKQYLIKGFKIISFIALPLSFGLFAISNSLVPWFYGDGFEKVAGLIRIFSPILFFMGISDLLGTQYLIAIKKEKELFIINCIACLINILFDFILIPFCQSYGAAFATLISEGMKATICIFFSKSQINGGNVIRSVLRYVVVSFLMLGIITCLYINVFSLSTIMNTLILIVIGAVFYFIMMFIVKDEIALIGLNIFKSKIGGTHKK